MKIIYHLLEYDTVLFARQLPTFQRNLLLQFSSSILKMNATHSPTRLVPISQTSQHQVPEENSESIFIHYPKHSIFNYQISLHKYDLKQ
jgi:hypothetical protein